MNIQEFIAKVILGKNLGDKNLSGLERIEIKQFDPNNPVIDRGFHTQLDHPNTISDINVTQVVILNCGHPLLNAKQMIQCVCGRAYCPDCADSMKSCHRCHRQVGPCCLHHSITSGRDFCPDHWRWFYPFLGI